jgi:hypothetical protein
MDVQNVLLNFTSGITVGIAVVLGIIVLVSLGIPPRAIVRPRGLAEKSH